MNNNYLKFLRAKVFGSEDGDEITQAELDAMSPEEREFIKNMREITAANLKMAKEISQAADLASKDKWGAWTGKMKREIDPSKMFLTEAEKRKARMDKAPKKSKRKGKTVATPYKKTLMKNVAIGVSAFLVLGTTAVFVYKKKAKKTGSLSEKPIDFLSRKKELEAQGRIPGRITEVRGPFAPAVQQVPFQGQAEIIDLGAQIARRKPAITPDEVATMEAQAMNTFPQLIDQLGSKVGKQKLDQIAQINADNTMALIMDAYKTGRKLDFAGQEYTIPEIKVLLMSNVRAERNFVRNYGRVFASAIKRFDV